MEIFANGGILIFGIIQCNKPKKSRGNFDCTKDINNKRPRGLNADAF